MTMILKACRWQGLLLFLPSKSMASVEAVEQVPNELNAKVDDGSGERELANESAPRNRKSRAFGARKKKDVSPTRAAAGKRVPGVQIRVGDTSRLDPLSDRDPELSLLDRKLDPGMDWGCHEYCNPLSEEDDMFNIC